MGHGFECVGIKTYRAAATRIPMGVVLEMFGKIKEFSLVNREAVFAGGNPTMSVMHIGNIVVFDACTDIVVPIGVKAKLCEYKVAEEYCAVHKEYHLYL